MSRETLAARRSPAVVDHRYGRHDVLRAAAERRARAISRRLSAAKRKGASDRIVAIVIDRLAAIAKSRALI